VQNTMFAGPPVTAQSAIYSAPALVRRRD